MQEIIKQVQDIAVQSDKLKAYAPQIVDFFKNVQAIFKDADFSYKVNFSVDNCGLHEIVLEITADRDIVVFVGYGVSPDPSIDDIMWYTIKDIVSGADYSDDFYLDCFPDKETVCKSLSDNKAKLIEYLTVGVSR